jgi:hypothetical protein
VLSAPTVASVPTRRRPAAVDQRAERTWLIGLFVVLSGLAFLFPPNGDDWAWGSSEGIDRLDAFFAGYNGRYAGDFAVLALTRTPYLTPFVIGATLAAMVFLILDLSDNRTRWGYPITAALLLAMPREIWRQTVAWVSGFTNYTFAVLCLLIFLRAVKLDWQGRLDPRHRLVRLPAVVVFAFVAALFMENVTIYFVVAAAVLVVARRRLLGAVSADTWCWLVGFAAGAAAMFSNSAYRRAAAGSGYQQMTGLKGAFDKSADIISRLAVSYNLALNLALAVAICALATLVARERGWRPMLAPVVLVGGCLAVSYPLVLAESETSVGLFWRRFAGVSALLLLAALCAVTAGAVRERSRRLQLFGYFASAVLIIAPLVVVNPVGPRCFLASYVLLLVVLNLLLREVADRGHVRALQGVSAFAAVVVATLLAAYFAVYGSIFSAAQNRIDYVRAQVRDGATHVTVPALPFTDFMHVPDPSPGVWEIRYKLFYGLPAKLEITLAPARR